MKLFEEVGMAKDTYRMHNITGEFLGEFEGAEALKLFGECIYNGWYSLGRNDRGGWIADVWVITRFVRLEK